MYKFINPHDIKDFFLMACATAYYLILIFVHRSFRLPAVVENTSLVAYKLFFFYICIFKLHVGK